MSIDLHTHTTASDGALSPSALLQRAIDNGVKILAITDHDTIDGYLLARDNPLSEQLHLVSGVELSTEWKGCGIHVVGLNFDVTHTVMCALLRQQTETRKARAQEIIYRLRRANLSLTLDDVARYAKTGQIGRPHIAQALVEKNYVSNANAAFKKYLGAGKIGDVKKGWVDLKKAIETIIESGGVAVLAHPNHYKMTRTRSLSLIDDFCQAGGQAIEVISGKQPQDITQMLSQIAKKHGLCGSLGSDFHRPLSYAADVGTLSTFPSGIPPVWELFN